MKQGGYLLITVVAIVFLIVILVLTSLDTTRTRHQRKLADKLLKEARERVFEEQAATGEEAGLSNIDEMKILHDVVFRSTIPGAAVEQLARSVHSAYMARQSATGETSATNPSMMPWEELPENLRQSNIAEAAGIRAELKTIGAIVVPESTPAPAFAFTDQEVEQLAQLEHQRWMRKRLDAGWRYGQLRDNERKIHPELQGWDYLSEAERERNRDAVRAIPAILHAAGQQILRVTPNA